MTRATRLRAVFVLLAVFVAGVIAGLVLEEVVLDDWWVLEALERPDDAEERILGTLSLSLDQRRRIQQLLEVREERLESYWLMQIPELRELVTSSRAEIRRVLTDEQRARYDRGLTEGEGAPSSR